MTGIFIPLLFGGMAPAAAAVPQTGAVTVRAGADWSDAAIRYIAEIGTETDIAAPPDTPLKTLVIQKCGDPRPVYMEIAVTRNGLDPVNPVVPATGRVTLPACIKWTAKPKVLIAEPLPLASFLTATMGKNDSAAKKSFFSLNKGWFKILKSSLLPKGAEFTVPYQSDWTTLLVKPGKNADTVAATLANLDAAEPGESASYVGVSGTGSLIPSAPTGSLQSTVEDCGTTNSAVPFDMQIFRDVLARNRARAMKNGSFEPAVAIGILDSGLAGPFTDPFVRARLKIQSGIPDEPGSDEDLDGDFVKDELFGPNAVSRRGWAVPPLMDDRDHGTIIAGIALGGPDFLAADKDPQLADIKLRIAMVTQPASPFGGPGSITDAAIGVALDDFYKNGVDILNASFKFDVPIGVIPKFLKNQPNMLMIAAAGNDHRDLSAPGGQVWPAVYAGDDSFPRTQIVTVGAARSDGRRAAFSNYGQNYVDLLAPGCMIASYTLDHSITRTSGTSQAAPAVSFIAALLRQLGLGRPKQIRDRLLVSVDEVYDLRGEVRSSGVLNPIKAVSLYEDVVQGTDKKYYFGKVSFEKLGPLTCTNGDNVVPAKIAKLAQLEQPGGQSLWRARWVDGAGSAMNCLVGTPGGTVLITGSDSISELPASQVRDVVFRAF